MPFSSVLNDLHSEAEAPLKNFPALLWGRNRNGTSAAGDVMGEKNVRLKGVGEEQRAKLQRRRATTPAVLAVTRRWPASWTLEATGQAQNTIVVFTSDHAT